MKKYSFIETGWFTASAFVIGAFLGSLFSTGFFSKLGEIHGPGVALVVASTVIGGFAFVAFAIFLRRNT